MFSYPDMTEKGQTGEGLCLLIQLSLLTLFIDPDYVTYSNLTTVLYQLRQARILKNLPVDALGYYPGKAQSQD